MAKTNIRPTLRHLRHLIGTGLGGMSDGQLLDRFVDHRDEDAIAELVRRYGGLVLGVCKRVLADGHTAEDVFQATFLVLVRKAGSLDARRPLGNWLYTVAYRLALTARAGAARRRLREGQAAQQRPEASALPPVNELFLAVEEELHRLPERHRAPLVLCYVEGKTNEQAAQVLGWPRGSISRRLDEARALLKERLRCRGYAGTATGVALLLASATTASATVPLSLLDVTVQAALWFASEQGATVVLSAEAVTLAKKVLHTMALQKLKVASALLVAAGLLGGTGTLLVQSVLAAPPAELAAADPLAADHTAEANNLPAGALARMGSTQLRHGDSIHYLGYANAGRWLITAGLDQTIRLWDVDRGTELRRFERPAPKVASVTSLKMEMKGPGAGRIIADRSRRYRVALSPDGTLLAATRGLEVHVWDVASGKLLWSFAEEGTGPFAGAADLAFAADGRSLVAVNGDRAATVWDLRTGKLLRRVVDAVAAKDVPEKGQAFKRVGGTVALGPGGRCLAWEHYDLQSQSSSLKVLDLTSGKEVGECPLPVQGAKGLTFAPDGKTIAWGSFHEGIELWDCMAQKEPRHLVHGQGDRHDFAEVESMTFSADGKTLAACRSDRAVQLWDIEAGKLVHKFGGAPEQNLTGNTRVVVKMVGVGLGGNPVEVAFAPDGKTIATSLGGSLVRRYETSTGKEIAAPTSGHAGAVTAINVAPDGSTLVSGTPGDVARVWDIATGRETRQIRLPADAALVAFATDGRTAATASGGSVTLWDVATGRERRKLDVGGTGVATLALSPDGNTLATRAGMSKDVQLWDCTTGAKQQTLTATAAAVGVGDPTAFVVTNELSGVMGQDLVFAPDGRTLLGAGPKRQLCLWDVATGATKWEHELAGDAVVDRFAFSASGMAAILLNRDGTVSLHETATGEFRCRLGEPTTGRAGATAVMVGGSPVMLAGMRREAPTPAAIATTRGGRFVAAAHTDPAIQVWDVVTRKETGRLKGHEGGIVSLAFSADGSRLVSGSLDTTALVWEMGQHLGSAMSSGGTLSQQELDTLWAALAGKDAATAFTAQCKLCQHPAEIARIVKQFVHPAALVDQARLAELIRMLEGRNLAQRQKAATELEALGEQARTALEKVLAGDVSLELRQRGERLLAKIVGKTTAANAVRDLRAVETLEMAGGDAARQALKSLAEGAPQARLTREARAALDRLAARS